MGAGAIGDDPRGAAAGGQKVHALLFSCGKRPQTEVHYIVCRHKRTDPLTPRVSLAPWQQATVMEGRGSRSESRRQSSSWSESAEQSPSVATVWATRSVYRLCHSRSRGGWLCTCRSEPLPRFR